MFQPVMIYRAVTHAVVINVATMMLSALLVTGYAAAQEVTPRQQEGPYYPVETLDDRDNDLTVVDGSSATSSGDLLLLSGRVVDTDGQPVAGAVVEIWQTDSGGAYMHPNDPATSGRDMNFQFYGEAVTAGDGSYAFRTILPGQYEPRPRHIHFKVRLEGEERLTSQFYFEGYEGAGASTQPAALTVQLSRIADDGYPVAYEGRKDIVLSRE